MRKNMEKGKDRASKLFFSDPDRAKDLVSLVLRMRGIKAELTGLAMEDPAVSFLDTRISMERLLDKMYKVKLDGEDGSTFCLIGLENQSSFDVHMLIRAGIASLLIYDWKLSLKEEMKPVIIVVLNMSDRKWGGKLKLEDYFSKNDLEVLGPLMVNVEMLVIDPHTMGEEEFEGLTTDLELILKVIKNKSDKRAFYDYIKSERRFANLDEVTAKLFSELTNIEKNEEDDMCKAVEDLINDSKAEGRAEGEAITIFKLRRDGLIQKEIAAERLRCTIEEYERRENLFFS